MLSRIIAKLKSKESQFIYEYQPVWLG